MGGNGGVYRFHSPVNWPHLLVDRAACSESKKTVWLWIWKPGYRLDYDAIFNPSFSLARYCSSLASEHYIILDKGRFHWIPALWWLCDFLWHSNLSLWRRSFDADMGREDLVRESSSSSWPNKRSRSTLWGLQLHTPCPVPDLYYFSTHLYQRLRLFPISEFWNLSRRWSSEIILQTKHDVLVYPSNYRAQPYVLPSWLSAASVILIATLSDYVITAMSDWTTSKLLSEKPNV